MNIKLGPLIGAGNFGEVYKGLWRDRFVVAVKTLKFNDQEKRNVRKEEARKEEFRKELEIMKKLRHEKLVKLWCVCTIDEPVYIVTEYMCNGSLLKYMREGDGMALNFKEVIDMAAQIACGMKYLEASRCVHRDLAARNILVGERNIVKIADFGFAQMLNSNDKLELSQDESNKFPVKWTAPEVFTVDPQTGLRAYTIKSDVWSFGILLYELITLGANPYPGNCLITYTLANCMTIYLSLIVLKDRNCIIFNIILSFTLFSTFSCHFFSMYKYFYAICIFVFLVLFNQLCLICF